MRHATEHVHVCLDFPRGYGTGTFGNGLRAATCHVHAPLLSVGSGIRTWVYVSLAPNFLRRRVLTLQYMYRYTSNDDGLYQK